MAGEFNLLREPWLPVRLISGGVVRVGLLELFAQSRTIAGLAETSPPSVVAQYRLLLAITHRALSSSHGRWRDQDRARWYRDGLPLEYLNAYLERWEERFWLFHPVHPFMQVAALAELEETREKRKPWTQMALASANGNTPVVFDHALDQAPKAISPEEAITTLLGFLQFTPGGLVKVLRDADKAGPLVNTAAIVPVGGNLSQTLCLALHGPPREGGDPDLTSWEREPPGIRDLRADPILASGPNDRYTRQSRAVLLSREADGYVRWIRFAAGLALAEDPNAPDPMASFRAGSSGLVRLTFNDGRAFWRDLPALVPSAGATGQAAAVVQYAIGLHRELDPFETPHQALLVAGVASDQAKLLRWRMEQLALPVAVLTDGDKALLLRERIEKSEALFSEVKRIAVGMVSDTLPTPSSKDTRGRARDMVDAGPLAPTYFALAERQLPALLEAIGRDALDEADELWTRALRSAAEEAWGRLLTTLGSSPRATRADGRHWPRVRALVRKQLPLRATPTPDEEAVL